MNAIEEYRSFRDFLRAAHAESKKASPGLSIELYAKRLGLSGSLLKMILTGRRGLTISQIQQVARSLRMSFDETAIFEAMVLLELSKTVAERVYYRRRLKDAKTRAATRRFRASGRELLSDPQLPALLVYLMESGIERNPDGEPRVDYGRLAKVFGSTPETMKAMVSKLRGAGLLSFDAKGGYHIVVDALASLVSQKEYLRKTLLESMRRLETDYQDANSFFTQYTFTASTESLQSLQLDLKALMDKYLAENPSGSVKIAQASFQVYPTVSIY